MRKLGEQDITDWIAFYQLEQEDEQAAIDKAKEEAKTANG